MKQLRRKYRWAAWIQRILALLILTAITLLVHDVARKNAQHFCSADSDSLFCPGSILFRIHLLDSSAAIALVVGLITVWIVREQFSIALAPVIGYYSARSSTHESLSRKDTKDLGYWNVEIKNSGSGLAILESISYDMEFQDPKPNDKHGELCYTEVRANFENHELKLYADYILTDHSIGASISPQGAITTFACHMEVRNMLKYFNIKTRYRSILGDDYKNVIHCVPRRLEKR